MRVILHHYQVFYFYFTSNLFKTRHATLIMLSYCFGNSKKFYTRKQHYKPTFVLICLCFRALYYLIKCSAMLYIRVVQQWLVRADNSHAKQRLCSQCHMHWLLFIDFLWDAAIRVDVYWLNKHLVLPFVNAESLNGLNRGG